MNYRSTWLRGLLLVALNGVCRPALAQDEASPDQEPVQQTQSRESDARVVGSFFDDISQNSRRQMGFSLGVYEMYTDKLYATNARRQDALITAFAPRVYANFGRRRSTLHLDYGGGYKLYHRQRELDNADHRVGLQYHLQAARRIAFRLVDRASSSVNDPVSSFGSTLVQAPEYPVSSYDPFLSRQRIRQNDLRTTLDFQVSRAIHLGIFGSYQIYRYDNKVSLNSRTDGIQAGASYTHRIAKWLTLASNYSTYLNRLDERYQDSKVHRLEIGGFDFRFGPNWGLYASGGAEFLEKKDNERRAGATARAELTRKTLTNTLFVHFKRAFMSANGLSRILQSNTATAGMGQSLTRYLRFQISASYIRSRDAVYAGLLEAYAASSSMEIALCPSVIATLSYTHQRQKNTIAAINNALDINRNAAYVGIQYLWPSSGR